MKNNPINISEKTHEELPIEEEYQEEIIKWLDRLASETGLPLERIITEIFLHRMSIEEELSLWRK